jgi:hypothetical protein
MFPMRSEAREYYIPPIPPIRDCGINFADIHPNPRKRK